MMALALVFHFQIEPLSNYHPSEWPLGRAGIITLACRQGSLSLPVAIGNPTIPASPLSHPSAGI